MNIAQIKETLGWMRQNKGYVLRSLGRQFIALLLIAITAGALSATGHKATAFVLIVPMIWAWRRNFRDAWK